MLKTNAYLSPFVERDLVLRVRSFVADADDVNDGDDTD